MPGPILMKMRKSKITISVEEYEGIGELPDADRDLLELATRAAETSYSPYSSFRVGSAVRLAGGQIITGSNQENAAYPSGMCAERVALFYATAQHPDVAVESIAVFATSSEFQLDQPVTPCGSCRQVMAEYENRHHRKIRIIMGNNGHVKVVDGIESLLPLMFVMEKLKRGNRE
jgi:cytidine deaminase